LTIYLGEYAPKPSGDAAFDATLSFPVVRDPSKIMLPTPAIPRRSIAIVLTDGRVQDPNGEVPRAAAALGRAASAVEVVDTEEGPVRVGLAGALADAAGGRVHRLVPMTTRRAA